MTKNSHFSILVLFVLSIFLMPMSSNILKKSVDFQSNEPLKLTLERGSGREPASNQRTINS